MIRLNTIATENSTFPVRLTFTDEDGAALVPSAVTWTLTDLAGLVINSREDVAATPGATVTIVLSGADLEVGSAVQVERMLTVEATYSSSLGAGLPLVEEIRFYLQGTVRQ